jgi:hypothetical protein
MNSAGYRGDGGPARKAQFGQPHSILFDSDGSLLICDIRNHRIRRVHVDTGVIETYAGTGEATINLTPMRPADWDETARYGRGFGLPRLLGLTLPGIQQRDVL